MAREDQLVQRRVRITHPYRDGIAFAGFQHPAEATYPPGTFTDDELAAIQSDAGFQVEVLGPEGDDPSSGVVGSIKGAAAPDPGAGEVKAPDAPVTAGAEPPVVADTASSAPDASASPAPTPASSGKGKGK
jgi:hypothetical protein